MDDLKDGKCRAVLRAIKVLVFIASWRHALRSEWPFIFVIVSKESPRSVLCPEFAVLLSVLLGQPYRRSVFVIIYKP